MSEDEKTRKAELAAQIEAAKADLAAKMERATELRLEIPRVDAHGKQLRNELRQLHGDGWHGNRGEIGEAEALIVSTDRLLADMDAVRVVWASGSSGWLSRDGHMYIVSRVTKKRIFIRGVGGSNETQFQKDGIPVGSYGNDQIDLDRTFAETEFAEQFA